MLNPLCIPGFHSMVSQAGYKVGVGLEFNSIRDRVLGKGHWKVPLRTSLETFASFAILESIKYLLSWL